MMASNPELQTLMQGLRGANMDTADFAAQGVEMRVVEVTTRDGEAGLPLSYDPDAIAAFWATRPFAVAQRVVQLLAISGNLLSSFAWDAFQGRLAETEVQRACQVREIVTSLGPAYIKLGQALAIRPDLLSPAAMVELQKLCDKVPSFPSDVAMRLIESELGAPHTEFFSELSAEPIAAASLGQVYKGRLRSTGELVAVKVQRPYVLETVTVDLFVLRAVGLRLREWFPKLVARADLVALLDEWASKFFMELDYVNEARNGQRFAEQMAADLPQVVVPRTFPELTSRRVLTCAWLEGEKLSQSTAADVGDLVSVGVICYLKQLLDTGFFHADPHPGNLIRTPDGRLAVLDFGLMTEIDDDIKFGMVEAISHLIHRDYEAIVRDFVTLDFIPPDTDLKPLLPALTRVFDRALEGGGAKNFNFQELAADLAQITFEFPFRIPPYFALIIRAIGVLEGIALVGNPDFALVDEAYPYISKRLLTDDSPRLREALRYMVYGKKRVLDADRLIDILESYESFQVASKSAAGTGVDTSLPAAQPATPALALAMLPAPAALPALPLQLAVPSSGVSSDAREALTFVFSPQGRFFRDFIIDEIVKGIDASARVQAAETVSALGLSNVRLPLLLPFSSLRSVSLAPHVTQDDRDVVANCAKLLAFLSGGKFDAGAAQGGAATGSMVPAITPRLVQELLPFMPDVAREIAPALLQRLSSRIAARTIREALLDPQHM
jgi:aarF domain-containing kinase